MKFIFEIKTTEGMTMSEKTLNNVRKMMVSFELMLNTCIPEFRVHLREEE